MKPVAIFRYAPTEGPGYFATYLDRNSIPWQVIGVDVGDALPSDPRLFSGLAFMGGPMSVNDDLPWVAWCESGGGEISRSKSPAVQSVAAIKAASDQSLGKLHAVADGVYARWTAGLVH